MSKRRNIEPLLRRPEVERLVGLKKSQIYQLMREGLFPRPVRIGKRSCGWRRSELGDWIDIRPPAGSFDPGGNANGVSRESEPGGNVIRIGNYQVRHRDLAPGGNR